MSRVRRFVPPLLVIGSLTALVLSCFGDALFRDGQFAFRDAGHFYYPLYKVVAEEWAAGRVPLWNPWENGGVPLLGTPTAAVLYPGKVIYAALPYAWAGRLYIIAHVLLAAGAMYALLRHWGTSRTGSAIGALSYAFGVPVLFQYCNVPFLVGAAWMPLGLRAADRLVRLGRRWGAVELAIVLAMQTLGGDPQATYVLGLLTAGYAVCLAGARRVERSEDQGWRLGRLVFAALLVSLGVAAWIGLVIWAGLKLPELRPEPTETRKMPVMPWTPHWPGVLLGTWAILALLLMALWSESEPGRRRLKALGLLLGSALLAGLIAAAQLLPTLEFSRRSVRAAREGPHEIYGFSVEPYRVLEMLWPDCFALGDNQATWMSLLPPFGAHKTWVPSLYLGGPALVLALAAFGFRGRAPGRAWLSAIALFGLLASLGTYSSPLWYARHVPALAEELGPHDPSMPTAVRLDGELRDGEGGFYWLLATALPGFDEFRYPAKFLTVMALGLAGLAGLGWDRLAAGRSGRVIGIAAALLILTFAAGVLLTWGADRFLEALRTSPLTKMGSEWGPLIPERSLSHVRFSLIHGGSVLAAVIGLALLVRRAPRLGASLAVALLALDLAVANHDLIKTVPQTLFDEDRSPRFLQVIEDAERESSASGLFRIHHLGKWHPLSWRLQGSTDRYAEIVAWDRDTLLPKYALLDGYEYTQTQGTAELYDMEFFFGPFFQTPRPEVAARLSPRPNGPIIVHPRRGFDLWNTRYFILPAHVPSGWDHDQRGHAAFLSEAERIYPKPQPNGSDAPAASDEDSFAEGRLKDPADPETLEDVQVLRNLNAYPRAWVVHKLRFLPPIRGLDRDDRINPMNEILYRGGPLWVDPSLVEFDPTEIAWVEVEDPETLLPYNVGGRPRDSETVEVVVHEPQRVVLEANLSRPGLVVLADAYYPGWTLTIDGEPAPIIRTNRMMRGAAVPSGTHTIEYTYEPASFRIGSLGSVVGLGALLIVSIWSWRRPVIRGALPPESSSVVS